MEGLIPTYDRSHRAPIHAAIWCIALALLPFCGPSHAVQVNVGGAEFNADLSVTLGGRFRTEESDSSLVCRANGGTSNSCNFDDGNLNYSPGLTSLGTRLEGKVSARYGHLRGFLRAIAFEDVVVDNANTHRTALTGDARELLGSDIRVLDFYGAWDFELSDRPGSVQVGKQTIAWGEAFLIPSGLSAINPLDASLARLPGAELNDALSPTPLFLANLELSDHASAEFFYQLTWDKTTLDPVGSSFSLIDHVGTGASRYVLGFGDVSDRRAINPGLGGLGGRGLADPDFLSVRRGADVNPPDTGQFGLALRLFAPNLNQSEFGFYFARYHSRRPVGSATTGTRAGVGNAVAAATASSCFLGVQSNCPQPVVGTTGNLAASVAVGAAAGVASGADNATGAANAGVVAASNIVNNGATSPELVTQNEYTKTARYNLEYPDDITLFGFSFTTGIPNSGITLQGDITHQRDVPLQVDDAELFLAAVTPLSFLNTKVLDNQLTRGIALAPGQRIPGFIRRNVSHAQVSATRVFGRALGWTQFSLVAEASWLHVHDMPNKDALRIEAPGTFTSGNPNQSLVGGSHAGKPAQSADEFADANSWGYRIAGIADYNFRGSPLQLHPYFVWQHDVQGNSPAPIETFVEDRKAITLGIKAEYQARWSADIHYT
ncbi:MAG: DUF1302 domain-containing protein, partial [Gammaproteobacteria bacterium]|nr:DUF1302 domain-containing protein [Gammaproteobacteria bacterium]